MGAGIDRRDFLRGAATSAVAAGALGTWATTATAQPGPGPGTGRGGGGRRVPPPKIGLQLYTVRNAISAMGLEPVLARLAQIGYREVELAGQYGLSAAELRETMDRYRMRIPSSHIGLNEIRGDWPQFLRDAQTLGQQYIGVAFIPANNDLDFWRGIAQEFNEAGRVARDHGLTFFYHNHNWEFDVIDGERPYDILLDDTDPRWVQFELDLYWIVFAGVDPLTYFEREPRRFPLLHVKDLLDRQWADVGDGEIDFGRIFRANPKSGAKRFFVEHDNPPDPLASVENSYDYLREELRY